MINNFIALFIRIEPSCKTSFQFPLYTCGSAMAGNFIRLCVSYQNYCHGIQVINQSCICVRAASDCWGSNKPRRSSSSSHGPAMRQLFLSFAAATVQRLFTFLHLIPFLHLRSPPVTSYSCSLFFFLFDFRLYFSKNLFCALGAIDPGCVRVIRSILVFIFLLATYFFFFFCVSVFVVSTPLHWSLVILEKNILW